MSKFTKHDSNALAAEETKSALNRPSYPKEAFLLPGKRAAR